MTSAGPRALTRTIRAVIVVVALALPVGGGTALATTTPPDETLLTLPPDDTAPPTTDNEFLDLEKELGDCVGNFNAGPGCGREPTHAGDRGGPLQWTVFGVMIAGIGFIGWRIVVGARRNVRATP